MSDKDTLRDKLQKLVDASEEITDGWRRIGGSGSLASAVAAEIDETVLPRKINLRNGENAVLSIEAGHRRLRRFLPPAPQELTEQAPVFEALRLDPVEDLDAIGMIFARHFGAAGEAWVQSDPVPSGAGGGQTGVTSGAVRDAWLRAGGDVFTADVDPAEAVDDFIDWLARHSLDWVVLSEGEIEAQSGPDETLSAAAPALWDSAVGSAVAQGPVCCVLQRSEGEDGALVFAGDAERGLVARVTQDTAIAINAAWWSVWT